MTESGEGCSHRLFFRLRNKITLPFAVLTLLVAAAGTFLTVHFLGTSLEDRLASYVADAIAVTDQGVTDLQNEQLATLRAMAHTEGVPQAIAARNVDQLTDLLVPLKMNYGVAAVEVVDITGQELLGIRHRPDSARAEEFTLSQGLDLSSWPIVQRILAGEVDQLGDRHAEILPSPAGHVLWIGGPVKDAEGIVGGILVGTYLDDLARGLTEKAVARVSLYDVEGHGLASTLFPDPADMSIDGELLARLRGASQSALLEPLEWQGREYVVGYAPLMIRGSEVGFASAAVSTEHISQSSLKAQLGMIALFCAMGLAVLFLGYFIAGHITTPLRSLVAASRHIAAGDFSQRVHKMSRDEIGQLARAFNLMAGELEKQTEELSHRIAELTILYDTSTELNKTLDLAEILKVAVEALYKSGEVTLVLLLLRREITRDWSWVAAKGLSPAQRQELLSSTLKSLPRGFVAVLRDEKPLILDDKRKVETLKSQVGLDVEVGSLMVIPLTSPAQIIGFILLGRPETSGFSDETQVRLLHTVSAQISQSIQNARLYDQVRENVHYLAMLHRASTSISGNLSRDDVLKQIVSSMAEITRANRVAISLWDPISQRLELGTCSGSLAEQETGHWPGQDMAECAVLERHSFTATDGKIVPATIGDEGTVLGHRLAVPMLAESQVLGSIFVELSGSKDRFLPSDLLVLTTAANQAAVALKNALLYEDIKNLYHNVVRSLAAAIDARDPYTHGHSHRVAANSLVLAEYLWIDHEYRRSLETAAYLHDIGKLGVRDTVLLKDGPLSSDEKRSVEDHPVVGARILEPVGFDEEVISIILSHHERIDGQGYPSGLKDDAIPLGARILCVADAFDAMVSDRPYRSALSVEAAVEELRLNAGTQFDPMVVERFTAAWSDGRIVLPGLPPRPEPQLSEAAGRLLETT